MKRLGFISVVAVGMLGCQSDRSLPPGPSALIQDAAQNGGNSFFFWQPPIANHQPPATQVLSRQLRPVVTITNEGPTPGSSATCNQGTVLTFSGSDISISESQYHVNWDTDQSSLNAGCDYRITVTAASTVMGFADVDVVNSGSGLKNIDTQEDIALLDGRTLPIKFFIGVGSLCGAGIADCGEGVARGGQNTTIVTTSGRAGVFIPANALDPGVEVAITVKSVDEERHSEFECIPGLFQQYPGTAAVANNACYDYNAEPILAETPAVQQSGRFTFENNVTVGICPDVVANDLEHPTRDLLQLFQFDAGVTPVALKNVPAPFLRCDPSFSPNFGARRSILGDLARAFGSLLTPRPLFASSNRLALDIGTGGETDGFSRFTWALPFSELIDFDVAPDGSAIIPGAIVNSVYARLGVTFSRSDSPLESPCSGTAVYANSSGGEQNNVSVCPEGTPSEFSEAAFGAIQATFRLPAVQACITATPQEGAQAYIEAFSAKTGESLDRSESSGEGGSEQLCVSGEGAEIGFVRFAGMGAGLASFDNLFVARALAPIE